MPPPAPTRKPKISRSPSTDHRLTDTPGLEAAFERVAGSGVPEWWSLEGPPGWGKTRLVQELYGRLAACQPEPRYWPPDLLPSASGGGALLPDAERKRVAPDPDAADRSALPSFFWWGMSCLKSNETAFQALVQDLGQFRAHEAGLERRLVCGTSRNSPGLASRNSPWDPACRLVSRLPPCHCHWAVSR